MNSVSISSIAFLFSLGTAPARAQDAAPSPITVIGSETIPSDYRLQGVPQTDREMASLGVISVAHESGLYVGTWASELSGWGTSGGANTALGLIGGYKSELPDISRRDAAYQPSFSKGQYDTGSIADGAVVAPLTASF